MYLSHLEHCLLLCINVGIVIPSSTLWYFIIHPSPFKMPLHCKCNGFPRTPFSNPVLAQWKGSFLLCIPGLSSPLRLPCVSLCDGHLNGVSFSSTNSLRTETLFWLMCSKHAGRNLKESELQHSCSLTLHVAFLSNCWNIRRKCSWALPSESKNGSFMFKALFKLGHLLLHAATGKGREAGKSLDWVKFDTLILAQLLYYLFRTFL